MDSKITDKYCTYDGRKVDETLSNLCKLCGYVYCREHLLPQRHRCAMLQNVEYVKTDSFSSMDQSTSSDKFEKTLDRSVTQIETSVEKISVPITRTVEDATYWLSDCLKDAQNMIIEHHHEKPDDMNFGDCATFFASKTFGVKIQNNDNASGDINMIRDLPSQPSYTICINDVLGYDTRDNRRMVTIILIHQLLHAIHPSRMHDSTNKQNGINRLEHEIANKASYHDGLLNLESLYQCDKITHCHV
ncbi:AN1-type zinc finger protein [Candidatus Nitrosotalea okcheonensis]|uniref:Uncharacterized protein n=1 Tax=Candidatus Nitrosotalea okcheonensis TaxID=1903276 RepID=A0A2H1FCQ2_9ARCH|nr:AN1-type zinc finger protein [Candidatus Nitrosotalea okcheonensis]MDE1728431.1 AN1-type zinc finger domain-containing protein [Nitrososphaerota archaeon]MDE1877175.1 AN1-type zinc finger domain-containing protein [Nitrososphaerota archaeon]SMH70429.1 protein of unknown function [Candidatus Nitrosotalea okcheonensis]